MNWLFESDDQSMGASASASVYHIVTVPLDQEMRELEAWPHPISPCALKPYKCNELSIQTLEVLG